MSAPSFGDTSAADRPTFGHKPGSVTHPCVARWGLSCSYDGPHDKPAPVDVDTVPAFQELADIDLWAPRKETDR